MDTSNLTETSSTIVVENTSNMIVMTPEMQYMKVYTQEKGELQNTISQQSAEIGKLLRDVEFWKLKYEAVFNNIV